jgi:hypothetical protein
VTTNLLVNTLDIGLYGYIAIPYLYRYIAILARNVFKTPFNDKPVAIISASVGAWRSKSTEPFA